MCAAICVGPTLSLLGASHLVFQSSISKLSISLRQLFDCRCRPLRHWLGIPLAMLRRSFGGLRNATHCTPNSPEARSKRRRSRLEAAPNKPQTSPEAGSKAPRRAVEGYSNSPRRKKLRIMCAAFCVGPSRTLGGASQLVCVHYC